jgi:membrane associated rhomboid family serine protease
MGISFEVLSVILFNSIISYKGFNDFIFFEKFHFKMDKIKNAEYYRLLTSGFLHVDKQHLIFNMVTLYFFGDFVLNIFGSFWFFCMYVICIFLGNIFCFIIHNKNNNYSAVGASGAVTGIIFSAILAYPDLKMALLIFPIPMPGYFFGIAYLAYTFYGIKKQNDGIGHSAHLGGAIGGILLSIFLMPSLIILSFKTLSLMSLIIVVGIIYFRKSIHKTS